MNGINGVRKELSALEEIKMEIKGAKCEIRSITQSEGGVECTTYSKKKEG